MTKEMDKIITPVFRVSFPQVFEAKAAPGSDKLKYSVVMLFKSTEDISTIKDMVKRTVLKKYPDGVTPTEFTTPYNDGNNKSYDGYADTIYMTASSLYPPGVVDEQKQPIINSREFYAGCYAVASVNAYCWTYMGKSGVSLGLQNIMKVNDGEPLTGGASAEVDFESISLPEGPFADATEGSEGSILDL